MDRFEEALTGLSITDGRSKEAVGPLLKRFLEASQELQRALTPLNGSVHAAMSRATPLSDEQTTSIDWVSVYDRVGLFDVDDRNVARLIDAALRYVWRKEEADALVACVGEAGNRLVAETRRALRDGEAHRGLAGSTVSSGDRPTSHLMTLPALRARIAFSTTRPRVCVPTTAALSAVRLVIKAVAESDSPATLCRAMGLRAFSSYQSFLIAEAGLTAETAAGRPQLGGGSTPPEAAASSASGAAAAVEAGAAAAVEAGAAVVVEAGAAAAVEAGAAAAVEAGAAVVVEAGAAAAVEAGAAAAVVAPKNGDGACGSGAANAPCTPEGTPPVGVDGGGGAGSGPGVARSQPPSGPTPSAGGDESASLGSMPAEGMALSGGSPVGGINATDPTDATPKAPVTYPDGTGCPVTSPVSTPSRPVGGASAEAGADIGASAGGWRGSGGGMPAAPAGSGLSRSARSTDTAATAHPAGVSDGGNSSSVLAEAARNPVGDTAAALTSDGRPETSADAPNYGAASEDNVAATAAAATPGTGGSPSSKPLVLGYLIAYLRTKHLTTWRFPGKGKGPAPPGTIANALGTVTVEKSRSLWCQRVSMLGIKPSFDVPKLTGRRHKLSDVPDEMLVGDLTDFKAKKIGDVVAALLLLCTYEPEAVRIVTEMTAGSFEVRRTRHPSLVLSGLELERVAERERAAEATGDSTAAGETRDRGDGSRQHGSVSAAGAAATAGGDGVARRLGDGVIARGGGVGRGAVGGNGAASGAADGNGGGAPFDGDGIREGHNVAVEAVYYLRVMREAADNRAKRLAVRRATRAKDAAAVGEGAACDHAAESTALPTGGRAAPAGTRPPSRRAPRRPPTGLAKRRQPAGSAVAAGTAAKKRKQAAAPSTAAGTAYGAAGSAAVSATSRPTGSEAAAGGTSIATPSSNSSASGASSATEGLVATGGPSAPAGTTLRGAPPASRGLTASEGPSATGTLSAGARPSPTRDASATGGLSAGGGPPASGCPSVGASASA